MEREKIQKLHKLHDTKKQFFDGDFQKEYLVHYANEFERNYYVDSDTYMLDVLAAINYKLGSYYKSYLYSEEGIQKCFSVQSVVFNILSLIRLGYFLEAENRFQKYREDIIQSYNNNESPSEYYLELFVLLDISDERINSNVTFNLMTNKISRLYTVMKSKNFKMILNMVREFNSDSLIKGHIYYFLAKYHNTEYLKYAYKFGYKERYLYDLVEFSMDELELSDFKSLKLDLSNFKEKYNVQHYDYDDERIKIYSYAYKSNMSMHIIKSKQGTIILDMGAAFLDDGGVKYIEVKEFLDEHGIKEEKILGILISHAHFDHYGSLKNNPLKCPIYLTKMTKEIIQESSSEYQSMLEDSIAIEENIEFNLGPFKIRPVPCGHILGAVAYDIRVDNKRIVYLGDFCLQDQYTVEGLNLSYLREGPKIDYLILETTYGRDSFSLSIEDKRQVIREIVKSSLDNGVRVMFPAFAVGRTQEVLLNLREGGINYPIFIDGAAGKMTQYYQKKCDSSYLSGVGIDINTENNKDCSLNYEMSSIIIASSGMVKQGSRSYSYLEAIKEKKKTTIIKVGYMGSSNLALKEMKFMDGKTINFYDISMSCHSSYYELISTMIKLDPRTVILVHGQGIEGVSVGN